MIVMSEWLNGDDGNGNLVMMIVRDGNVKMAIDENGKMTVMSS